MEAAGARYITQRIWPGKMSDEFVSAGTQCRISGTAAAVGRGISAICGTETGSKESGFKFDKATILFEEDEIHIYREHKLIDGYTVQEFTKSPNVVFRKIQRRIL